MKIEEVRISKFYYFYIEPVINNCKIVHVSSIAAPLIFYENLTIEELKKINKFFTITINNQTALKILRKHFKEIYCIPIPIGYYKEYQYHAMYVKHDSDFLNKNSYLNNYKTRISKNDFPYIVLNGIQIDNPFYNLNLKKIMSYKTRKGLHNYLTKHGIKTKNYTKPSEK